MNCGNSSNIKSKVLWIISIKSTLLLELEKIGYKSPCRKNTLVKTLDGMYSEYEYLI